jgi:hypothetical protein
MMMMACDPIFFFFDLDLKQLTSPNNNFSKQLPQTTTSSPFKTSSP